METDRMGSESLGLKFRVSISRQQTVGNAMKTFEAPGQKSDDSMRTPTRVQQNPDALQKVDDEANPRSLPRSAPRKHTPVAWGMLSSWNPYVLFCYQGMVSSCCLSQRPNFVTSNFAGLGNPPYKNVYLLKHGMAVASS